MYHQLFYFCEFRHDIFTQDMYIDHGARVSLHGSRVILHSPQLQGDTPQLQGDTPQLQRDTPQLRGDTPQLQGDTPQSTAPGWYSTVGWARFASKIFSLISEKKRNWIHFACVSLVHLKNSGPFFRFFSLYFASNFSLRFNLVIFASKRNVQKTFFRFKYFVSLQKNTFFSRFSLLNVRFQYNFCRLQKNWFLYTGTYIQADTYTHRYASKNIYLWADTVIHRYTYLNKQGDVWIF